MADSKVQAFENDAIIQKYFEKLKVLISKKSIFAQQIGLLDVATYLKEMFEEAGADVVLDDSYAAPFVMARFEATVPNAKTLITITMTLFQQMRIRSGRRATPLN